VLLIVAIAWRRLEFCDVCGAVTKTPLAGSRLVWCAGCDNLNDVTQIVVGDYGDFDLTGPAYLEHPDPVVRFLALVSLLAITDGAKEVRMEPQCDAYEVSLLIEHERHMLENPPQFIHARVAQTVKAITGLTLESCDQPQRGKLRILTSLGVVPTEATVESSSYGQTVVLVLHGISGANRHDHP